MKKALINFRPMLFLAISICLGIIVSYLFLVVNTTLAIILGIIFGVCCVLIFAIYLKKENLIVNIISVLTCILIFIFGAYHGYSKINNYKNANLNNHYYEVSAKIEKINSYDNYQTAICNSIELEGVNGGKINYKIRLFIYGDREFKVGDRIYFSAMLNDNDVKYHSRFASEQISDKIKYSASVNAKDIIVTENESTIFQKVNAFISNSLSKGLSGDEYGVAFALLTGDSSFIDGEVLSNFRYAGIAHVFAVSGLHIGVLAIALNFIMKKFKVNQKVSAAIVILSCLFYSGVCGFSSSSIRATIMCAVSLTASFLGKKYDGISSTCLAGIIILFFCPLELFCVGFQLSFSVVLGIFILSPSISKLLKFLPNKLSQSLGVSISAQIVSIPISLYAFNNVSLVSVFFNVVMIPIVSPLFVILLFSTIVGGILSISSILLFPIKYVLSAIIVVINFFDYKVLIVSGVVMGLSSIFYYGFFMISSGLVNVRKISKLVFLVIMSIGFIVGTYIKTINEYESVKCYVSGGKEFSGVIIKTEEKNALILSVAYRDFSLRKLENLKNQAGIDSVDIIIFSNYFSASDVQEYYTRINTVLSSDKAYYYGDKDFISENVTELSFPKLDVINYLDGEDIFLGELKIYSDCNGKLIFIKTENARHAVASMIGGYDGVVASSLKDVETIIAYEYQDLIFANEKNSNKISFIRYGDYVDAESNGIFITKLN